MKFQRQFRYYYLRFIRLRGQPHELALGIAFGVFSGMLPIMPFQIFLAVAMAMFFKGSKITAALGTWISNPLNWYFIYYYDYKLGAYVLGLNGKNSGFSSLMQSIKASEESMVIVEKILNTGGMSLACFIIGGLIIGVALAVPIYFVFLQFFRSVRKWREAKRRVKAN